MSGYFCADSGPPVLFSDIRNHALCLASYLSLQGNGPVGVFAEKEALTVICFLACVYSGRPVIPIDPDIPHKRIEYILDSSDSELVLCTPDSFICNKPCLVRDQIEIICKDYHPISPHEYSCSSTAYIIFTSGSTGIPKGVRVSIDNIENFFVFFMKQDAVRQIRPDIVLNQAAFSFDLSLADLVYALKNDYSLVCLSKKVQSDFSMMFDILKNSHARMMTLTPSFARYCLSDSSFSESLMPEISIFWFCGEVLQPQTALKLFDRFPKARIINAYGPTETTCAVTSCEITRDMCFSDLPVGEIKTSALSILIEDEDHNMLPEGQSGQITLYGRSVAIGYCNNTENGFCIRNNIPAFMTGDYGYIKDGLLYFTGRNDSIIKYRGYRISLNEIDNAVLSCTGVADVLTCAKYSPDNTVRSIITYTVCNAELNTHDLYDHLKSLLPSYMIPKNIMIVDTIPLNENKKRSRRIV